jgi:uncharacterized DUF497 family protein
MDKYFELNETEFEWDAEKYRVNVRNHGVKFEEAAEVFFDPENRFGNASIGNEFREFVIGYSRSWRVLFVVFLERSVRTISARRATPKERLLYEKPKDKR